MAKAIRAMTLYSRETTGGREAKKLDTSRFLSCGVDCPWSYWLVLFNLLSLNKDWTELYSFVVDWTTTLTNVNFRHSSGLIGRLYTLQTAHHVVDIRRKSVICEIQGTAGSLSTMWWFNVLTITCSPANSRIGTGKQGNRTIYLRTTHLTPFYLGTGNCHGRVRIRVRVRVSLSVWIRVSVWAWVKVMNGCSLRSKTITKPFWNVTKSLRAETVLQQYLSITSCHNCKTSCPAMSEKQQRGMQRRTISYWFYFARSVVLQFQKSNPVIVRAASLTEASDY